MADAPLEYVTVFMKGCTKLSGRRAGCTGINNTRYCLPGTAFPAM